MLIHKTAIITGANRGLGAVIARVFVENGASVLLCARNEEMLSAVQNELTDRRIFDTQRILICPADVSNEADVEQVFQTAISEFGKIDVLVNNAAVQGPIGPMENNSWELWRDTIRTDLFGPAYCIYKALPIMKRQRSGKIINLSGGGATAPRENYSAYAVAKTGVVRLTETIAKEAEPFGVYVNAIAPGAMTGKMLEETLSAGEDAVGKAEYAKALTRKTEGGVSPEASAKLCLFLASESSDGISGRLISAVWDDWEHFTAERLEKLKNSDIYTLRRIIPQDRGDNWDRS